MDGARECPKCGYKLRGPKPAEPSAGKVSAKKTEGHWTEGEDEQLIQFWNGKLTLKEIADKVPNRTEAAVKNRLSRLAKRGRIKSRWHKKGLEPAPPAPTSTSTPTSTPTHAPIVNTSLSLQLNVNCNDAKAVANFLKIIEKLGETLK
jgi:hypothetical protein